jgi:YVTN family beta-propeller protein
MEQIGTRCLAELEAASHNRSTKHSLRQGVYLAITLMSASMTSHAATWGRQFAYVVQEDVEQAKDYIVRVNVATGVVERRFDLGSGLGGGRLQLRSAAASTALQRVFFVEAFRARLISLDIHSGAVSQFSADNVPTGVVVSPNGAYVYVAASYDNTVLEFDARNVTRGALRTIPVGNRPVGISIRPDGAVAYTANALGNSVTAIDVSQNPPAIYSLSLVNEKHTNPRPLGIALDATGTRAYVSLGGDNSYVIALDTSEKQPHLAADLSVPSSAMSLGDTKLGIATSPTSSLLYAIAPGKNQLSYYDMGSDPPALGPVSNTYPNSYPVGVSVDGTGNRVLVQGDGTPAGDPNNGRLFVYEARTGQQQWTLRLGKGRALVGNVVLEDDVLLRDGFEP